MAFKLESEYKPTGDQPEAIKALVEGVKAGEVYQTLLGVTGSGKTFTMANIIAELDRPALILSHNKTLAAQLYGEFKSFFPDNLVEYFVSYYDYYQPEAFIPSTNTYIEKDLQINEEIEKLRLSTTSALLSGRKDVIVVCSVSCIFGIGNPVEFYKNVIKIEVGQKLMRNKFLHMLVTSLYSRNDLVPERGSFRVKGDVIEINLAYADHAIRISYWGDEIEEIETFDPESGQTIHSFEDINIYPANLFVTSQETQKDAIWEIQQDLAKRLEYYRDKGMTIEAERLEERVTYDLEMIKELGYCSGIENYSRYFDKRKSGERPFSIIDYFPDDFIFLMDESHVTNSQIKAMYGGDRSRKLNLVEHGFRLPSAIDNRPLQYEEFEKLIHNWIFVSATPGDFEMEKCEGVFVEQLIRPTGLLDPIIEVRPSLNQIDDLMNEINIRVEKDQRVLVTTLTKRMAEELTKYLTKFGIKCRYIHSEVTTIERIEILRDLRLGEFDVLIGVNLLREGLDLPEVSLVSILDADKEGFLRSERALIQTVGRAARHLEGKVIMYADKITKSMKKTIDKTLERREKQMAYNKKHNVTPKALRKSREDILGQTIVGQRGSSANSTYETETKTNIAADPIVAYMSKDKLEKLLEETKKRMKKASKDQAFMEAAQFRDEMMEIQKMILEKD